MPGAYKKENNARNWPHAHLTDTNKANTGRVTGAAMSCVPGFNVSRFPTRSCEPSFKIIIHSCNSNHKKKIHDYYLRHLRSDKTTISHTQTSNLQNKSIYVRPPWPGYLFKCEIALIFSARVGRLRQSALSKYFTLTLLGLGLIKINDVSANFNNPRPSLILNN